jgi:hypothetical protein
MSSMRKKKAAWERVMGSMSSSVKGWGLGGGGQGVVQCVRCALQATWLCGVSDWLGSVTQIVSLCTHLYMLSGAVARVPVRCPTCRSYKGCVTAPC